MFSTRIPTAVLSVCCAAYLPLTAADDHAGHDHAAHGHSATTPIGAVEIGGYNVAVAATGALAPGAEWHVDVAMTPAQTLPKAVRLWVGTENGRGSVKAKAEPEKDAKGEYAAHVELPKPMPADSKLWIALELENGQTAKGAVVLPTAASATATAAALVHPTPTNHHGHDHDHDHGHNHGHKH